MRRAAALVAAAAAAAALLAAQAAAHPGPHRPVTAEPAATPAPFPVEIRARFTLTDHYGRQVSEADFAGVPALLFFGYASCRSICSTALPLMAEALALLGEAGAGIPALFVTVDPERDTPEALRHALAPFGPRLVGLTGSTEAVAAARAPFQVEARVISDGPTGPILAHGSFIYLLGPEGRVLTLLPPILTPERMAETIAGYL